MATEEPTLAAPTAGTAALTMATLGRMKDFNPDNETVTAYLERFELFVEVNGIPEDKKVATLLTVIGTKHYSLLRGLTSPILPRLVSYTDLVSHLRAHFDPKPLVIAERYHFYQRNQKPGETVTEYLASLRESASKCNFRDFLNEALRDRLVCGLQSDAIQKALLSKADLTLESALQVAQSMEAAAQKTKDIKGANRSASVMTVSTPSGKAGACGRCGRGNHVSSECRFKSAKCHKCGKIGHIAPVCRSKRTQKPPKKPPHSTNYMTVQSEDNEPSEPIFVVGSSSRSSHPYVVTLQVNGCPLAMEVDTGAAVSLAPESALSSILSSAPLRTSNVVLKTYMGEKIPVKGVLSVSVGYGDQLHQNMELLVVQGSGPCLMGRDWLKIIRLDWKAIGQISSTNEEEFLSALK